MGGDTISPPSPDGDSLLEQELPDYSFELSVLFRSGDSSLKVVDGSVTVEKDLMLERSDHVGTQVSRDSLYYIANPKQSHSVYREVLRSYDELQCRSKSLEEAKRRLLRYKPGTWTEKVGGMELKDYIVPKTASLLLVGPERSGKSSLVNRVSRVFNDDKLSPERAQVSYNCNDGDGTYFLQENMVPRGSSSFCIYDTRSLSDNESENTSMLKQWMTEGVRHGELVIRSGDSSLKVVDGSVTVEKDLMLERSDHVGTQVSRDSLYYIANPKQSHSVYREVLRSYDELQCRSKSLEEAKRRLLRYKPGTWTEKVGGMELKDYIVPKTASLLLVGPERSGKSSLVNRVSRVFNDDKLSPERAQVSYNCNDGDGTYFLQENMVPRGSSSFCLYDTRSLSDNESENTSMLKQWMTEGVRHGELVISGISVLNCTDNGEEADDGYNKRITTMFKCPFLSFQSADDKPVVAVTHGDLLSLSDRACVRVHLGELLGIPPKKQIFDIPVVEDCDPATDLTIIDLLCYSLAYADKNFPAKGWFHGKIPKVRQPGSLILVFILGIAIISALFHNGYVYKLQVPQTDIAPEEDSPSLNTVQTPQAYALYVSQTDAPTGSNVDNFQDADNFRQVKYAYGMDREYMSIRGACLMSGTESF